VVAANAGTLRELRVDRPSNRLALHLTSWRRCWPRRRSCACSTHAQRAGAQRRRVVCCAASRRLRRCACLRSMCTTAMQTQCLRWQRTWQPVRL
jgi:hypothetical protein